MANEVSFVDLGGYSNHISETFMAALTKQTDISDGLISNLAPLPKEPAPAVIQ